MSGDVSPRGIGSCEHLRRELAKGRALLRRFRGGHFGAHGATPYEVDPLLLTGSHSVVAEGEAIHVGVKVLDPFVQPAHQRQPIANDRRALERELFSRGVHGRFERTDRGVAPAVEKGAHGHRRVAIRLRGARTDARTGAGAELVSQTAGGAGTAGAALWTRGGIVVEPERAAAARGAAGDTHHVIVHAVAQAGAFGQRPHRLAQLRHPTERPEQRDRAGIVGTGYHAQSRHPATGERDIGARPLVLHHHRVEVRTILLDEPQFAQQRAELGVGVLPLDLKRVAQNPGALVAPLRPEV